MMVKCNIPSHPCAYQYLLLCRLQVGLVLDDDGGHVQLLAPQVLDHHRKHVALDLGQAEDHHAERGGVREWARAWRVGASGGGASLYLCQMNIQ